MTLPQQDSSELRNDGLLARTSTLRRHVLAAAVSGIFAASFAGLSTVASGNPPPSDVGIKTLSARADLVSGGDVLVQITLKHENRNHPVVITLNDHDVTSAFHPGEAPNTLIGLVTGLNIGKKEIEPIETLPAPLRDRAAQHPTGIEIPRQARGNRTPRRFQASTDRLFQGNQSMRHSVTRSRQTASAFPSQAALVEKQLSAHGHSLT